MGFPRFKILPLLLLTACGSGSNTALVTLSTGLQEETPQSLNLMERMSKISTGRVGLSNCLQGNIMAGFNANLGDGVKDKSDGLSAYPVTLVTPLTTATAINTSITGPAGWLASSTLKAITLPAPTGVPLDFGVVGSLSVGTETDSDGNCPIYDPTTKALNASYSLIGHTQATIKKDTTIALNLWVTPSVATSVSERPAPPVEGTKCSKMSGSSLLSQQCPNLNFNQIKITCGSGSSCLSILSTGKVKLEYFNSGNTKTYITQVVNLSDANASGANAVLVPDTTPMKITILNSAGAEVEYTVIKSGAAFGAHFSFIKANGSTDQYAYAESIGGSGVTSND